MWELPLWDLGEKHVRPGRATTKSQGKEQTRCVLGITRSPVDRVEKLRERENGKDELGGRT